MKRIFKESLVLALSLTTSLFAIVPESVFGTIQLAFVEWLATFSWLNPYVSKLELCIICNRILCGVIIICIVFLLYLLYYKILKRSIKIDQKDYIIKVEYGDILKTKKCKKVINFDECYTTTIGDGLGDIKPTSLCGQYLLANPNLNINQLIIDADVQPERSKSKYQDRSRYKSGTLVPNGDDLLMAFAKLDEEGRGHFATIKEYLDSLSTVWYEIEKYYGQHDVCIPVLGAGLTRIGDGQQLSQQELVDMMILSYKLSPRKIKKPHVLRIICRRVDDFSLSEVGL